MTRDSAIPPEPHRETVHFGRMPITFTVEYRARKHLGITVHPDARVMVAAPVGTEMEEIRRRVLKRAPWILKQVDAFRRFRPMPTARQYLNGETHRYLGRQYRLRISEGVPPSVKLRGRYLDVTVAELGDRDSVRKLVDGWYRDHARVTFGRRMERCFEAMKPLGISPPGMIVRRIRARWGSCSRTGNVLLNVDLVKAPLECIDYVIFHELCHLVVPEHSPAFFRLLSRFVPDWQRRKDRLEMCGF